MPTAEPLTAIRQPSDLDPIDETAWAYVALYTPMPNLLFAVKERCRVLQNPTHTDWYTLKAKNIGND